MIISIISISSYPTLSLYSIMLAGICADQNHSLFSINSGWFASSLC